MKLAVASSAFDRAMESGDLTQLEFLDLCANDPFCDGIVLDVRHFPRTDDDYLAQVKKMAADRGLTPVALADAAFFTGDAAHARASLAWAQSLGAPLLAAPLAAETTCTWPEQLERLGVATSLAKQANVTLALRNRPGTFAASDRDCKRVSKETDSAWLRYGVEPAALGSASDPASLRPNTVLLWAGFEGDARANAESLLHAFAGMGGYVTLDDAGGAANADRLRAVLPAWYRAIAERTLDRT